MMRVGMRAGVAALALLLAAPATAGVVTSGADGFLLRYEGFVGKPPALMWDALVDWGGWWPDAHTYSGKASNLDLDVEADGELEEEWDGGAVLHGSVLQAMPGKMLRLSANFGPLQALPVNGVLDIVLKPEGAGTRVVMTYRVGGPVSAGLQPLALPVDAVLGQGFGRLLMHQAPEKKEEK